MNIAIVAPTTRPCGIADYTDLLAESLRTRVNTVQILSPAKLHQLGTKPDLAHIQHQYFLFGGVAPWKNRFASFLSGLRIPLVQTVHEVVTPVGNRFKREAIKLTNRTQFNSAAIRRTIVHTSADRDALTSCGVPESRIVLMPHPAPPTLRQPDRLTARTALQVETDWVVTIFGFLARKKGYATALEALALLPPTVSLILAGGQHPQDSTGTETEIREQITTLSLEDRVRITGYLEPNAVAAVMAASDIILAPFTQTSGSGSVSTALAYGKPVLASDIAPHRDLLRDFPGTMRLYSGDAGALASAVTQLLMNSSDLASMSQGAVTWATANSWDKAGALTAALYADVLRENQH